MKEHKHDAHLRKFEYSKALDSVMVSVIINRTPHVTVALFQELIRLDLFIYIFTFFIPPKQKVATVHFYIVVYVAVAKKVNNSML